MLFCDIFCQIIGARSPIVTELALSCPTGEPVELHIHGLKSLDHNVVCYYAPGFRVISLHRCGGLFVPHFLKGIPCWYGFAAKDIMRIRGQGGLTLGNGDGVCTVTQKYVLLALDLLGDSSTSTWILSGE